MKVELHDMLPTISRAKKCDIEKADLALDLVPVCHLDSDFPFTLSTLYSGHSNARYPWLTRTGPDGHRGRLLWIKVREFNTWCQNRGLKYRLVIQDRDMKGHGNSHEIGRGTPFGVTHK